MKGDYHRYLSEFQDDQDKEESAVSNLFYDTVNQPSL